MSSRVGRSEPMSLVRQCVPIIVCVLGVLQPHALGQTAPQAGTTASGHGVGIFSYQFLDLDDPCAVEDAAGDVMLTFAGFDANDQLVWVEGFESIDAWRTYAASDPCLAADRAEQVGWVLAGGEEDIFWNVQAIVHLCPEFSNLIEAIESRPVVYESTRDVWLVLGIERTSGANYFDLRTGIVSWNPNAWSAFGGTAAWDWFPPLVTLAHELVHVYQRAVEDRPIYTSPLQVPAMKYENLIRHAFYRKVPGYSDIVPRPGNAGFYLDGVFQYLFDDVAWMDWSPSYVPLLDVFEEQ